MKIYSAIRQLLVTVPMLLSVLVQAQIDSIALKDWRDQKYSMFIHFGLYSHLGGVWDGKPISRGLSEQIQAHAGIYSDTYANVANDFNPVKWNGDSIALLARNAGMRSIVLTSKHHDGFCMFHTKTTRFNIVDATPFKRDVVGELAAACKRNGLRFGLYFSLIDWHYPQASPISSHNSDYITPEHHEYNKKQVTELLTNYGPISELWFDMGSMSETQSREMRDLVHSLQPNCLIGSRIGNDQGDFTVMGDNQEPDYIIGVPWQSPASFFDETWGYRSWQKRVPEEEKIREKLTSLIRVASRGGNFLLNIGPKGDGSVVPYEKDVLLAIGQWLRKNAEAIYGTAPDPFHVKFDWGSITSRKNQLYLHILKMPANRTIHLPGISGGIQSAGIIGAQEPVRSRRAGDGIDIELPEGIDPEKEIPVVAILFDKEYSVLPPNIIAKGNRPVNLVPANAFRYFSNSGIDYNTRFTSTIREYWTLQILNAKSLRPALYYSAQEKGRKIDLEVNGRQQIIELSGGKVIPLNPAIKPGKQFLRGPLYSGIEGVHGKIDSIIPENGWPKPEDPVWEEQRMPGADSILSLKAGMMTAYYFLQELEADKPQSTLAEITAGEAVSVFLNGEPLYIANSATKEDTTRHTLLLHLKPGKNQLLIKLFNNFHDSIPFGIRYSIPQEIFRLELPAVPVKKGQLVPISWKLHDPRTPHEDLGMPNLRLELR